MGKSADLIKLFEKLNISTLIQVRRLAEKINIKKKKKLIESVVLTDEQKKEIDDFFKEHYGKKIKHHWHRLYQSYTGIYKKEYFPEYLLSTVYEPMVNPVMSSVVLGNKNLLKQLFSSVENVHIPHTYVCCVNGVLKDGEDNLIAKDDIYDIVKDSQCVIKKSLDTSSGRDVMICSFEKGIDKNSGRTIFSIIDDMGIDYVIQEKVVQSDELSAIYPGALNTFRVMTYVLDGDIYHCPMALRLAHNGADRDNIHYGGMCVGVDDEGYLYKRAFEEFGNYYDEHPDTKVKFDGYRIANAKSIISCAKDLHRCIPMLGIVSWDLTIDKDGCATLIEANTIGQSAWFLQMIQGKSLFGENTSRILEMIKGK